jgi:thioredoxin-related protein
LLEFAVERCEYCKRLEEEFLSPMRRNRDYDRRVVIRRVPLDTPENIFGFDGRPVEATVLAARYAVRITPTLVFVNARGEEIAESMVGFNTPELYGAYLHHALDTARAHLVEQEHCVEDQERPVFK